MTTIYFVRHAQPDYDNHDDKSRELSGKGMADRRLITEYLSGISIDVVVSSPFKRAVDTLEELARARGLEIEQIEDFRERRVDDCWIKDFNGFSKRQWEDFDYKLAGGESLREVQNRNIRALKKLLTRYQGKTVVVGSHGTSLSTIINYYKKDFGFQNFQRIRTLMPWIVRFDFQKHKCIKIESYNVFTKQKMDL